MKQISKVVGCVIIVGLLLVVLGAVPVAAAPCDVPSSAYPTIQAAVDDATCVIINVAAGTYTEHVAIDHNVMIRGEGQESTVVDGSGTCCGTVFVISGNTPGEPTVTINGVTIQNGGFVLPPRTGGGIFNSGTLTVQNSTVTGNNGVDGGGILNTGGTLTVLDSTIADNQAVGFGGGIWNAGGRLTVVNSTLTGNSSSRDGGGIFNYRGTVTLAHVTFENNTPNDCTGCP